MSSTLVSIADSIVDEMNGHDFSREFKTVRLYNSERELEELETLRVDVVCGDIVQVPISRTAKQGDYRVDIAVREKLDTDKIEQLDALQEFVEEIDAFFSSPPRRLTNFDNAGWVGSTIVYPYLPSHLREKRQFTSILRLTYRAFTQ